MSLRNLDGQTEKIIIDRTEPQETRNGSEWVSFKEVVIEQITVNGAPAVKVSRFESRECVKLPTKGADRSGKVGSVHRVAVSKSYYKMSPSPCIVMGSPVVGQWKDICIAVLATDNIEINTQEETFIDYMSWVSAFSIAYGSS